MRMLSILGNICSVRAQIDHWKCAFVIFFLSQKALSLGFKTLILDPYPP